MLGIKTVYASPVAAAGKVYFTSRDGTTLVLKHGAAMFFECAVTYEIMIEH
ncbi:MAG: hypothetical protein ABI557_12075 [Aureliella sp.]